MSKKEPKFLWDEKHGTTICILYYKDTSFSGTAECHPEDRDFLSKRTGEHIAYTRAHIDCLKYIYQYELKPQKEILMHLLGTMAHSKKFNENSYEIKRIKKELKNLNDNIDAVKDLIDMHKTDLALYIEEKDKFYKNQRKKKL